MTYKPIKSKTGIDDKHLCRRCKRTLPLEQFGPLAQVRVTKFEEACYRKGVIYLHPFCWKCRDQIKGEHTQHKLYSPKLDRFMERKFSAIKGASHHRGLPVFIDKEYLLGVYLRQGGLCALTGIQMSIENGIGCRNNLLASVDRIDSGKGYIAGNVHFVCDIINVMKSDLPVHRFVEYCRRVVEKQADAQDSLLQAIDGA